jgi:hypothetical protein
MLQAYHDPQFIHKTYYGNINKVLNKKITGLFLARARNSLNMVALAHIELPVISIQRVPTQSPKCEVANLLLTARLRTYFPSVYSASPHSNLTFTYKTVYYNSKLSFNFLYI